MINAQRWSVIILFVVFIIVMVWGNRHWEQSIRQQGARPASAANQPLNSGPVKAADIPSVADQQAVLPAAPSQAGAGNTNTVTLPGGSPQGSEIKPPSPPKTESPPVQKQGTGDKTTTKTTTAVTKSVYQR